MCCVTLAVVLAPLWDELTSWLAAHAPRTLEGLRPSVGRARIAAAEEHLGFALSAELVEWWQLHDGADSGYIVPGYELLGVEGSLRARQDQLDVNFEEEVNAMARQRLGLRDDEAGGPARFYPPEFVPVGSDGFGNHLVADLRPGPDHGCLRDHDHEDRGVIQPPYCTGLADLLTRMVTSLRTGQPMEPDDRHPRRPQVVDGFVQWNAD